MITRDEILKRARAIPLGSIPYSQTAMNPMTWRRSDCSGWVSYCWDVPKDAPGTYLGAYSTATFVTMRQIVEIPFSELRPGDAIGYCSPTSPGNGGHIALWLEGDHDGRGRHHVLDHGSGMGPKDRWVQWDGSSTGWLNPSHLKAWRYIETEDQMSGWADDGNANALIWRVEALMSGSETVEGGIVKGEPVWLVKAVKELAARPTVLVDPAIVEAAVRSSVRAELAELVATLDKLLHP